MKKYGKGKLAVAALAMMLSASMGQASLAAPKADDCFNGINVVSGAMSQAELDKNATKLTYGKVTTSVLDSRTDEKWFCLDVTQNGYFKINLKVNKNSDLSLIQDGWAFEIYKKDAMDTCIKGVYKITSSADSPCLGMEEGRYYVKVFAQKTSDFGGECAPDGCPFDITASYVATPYWESEANDLRNDAETIFTNKTYSGTIYNRLDEDWYKFNITKNGYFTVTLKPDKDLCSLEAIQDGWYFEIVDINNNVIASYEDIKTSGVTSYPVPFKKGTYFVKVRAQKQSDFGGTMDPRDQVYNLTVKEIANDYWEKENNDLQNKANTIKLGKTYKGLTYYRKDADWYKFKLTANGKVKVSLKKDAKTDYENVQDGWDFFVYNANTKELAHQVGIKSADSVTLDLKKGTYYIKVYPKRDSDFGGTTDPRNCIYDLRVDYTKTPAQAKLEKVTGGKKSVKLQWKKAANASGYYIYRSTSKGGKYKKIATVKGATKTTYTDKKLKAKKRYYYKVVSYRVENKLTATGKASNIKYTKTK